MGLPVSLPSAFANWDFPQPGGESRRTPRGRLPTFASLCVLARKTEHHGAEHAVRVVPICPELRSILADGFERADPGATLVVPLAARQGTNLRTQLERIIVKAGHEPWPRLLQNLRASRETDWVEHYPAHAVAKWLGHSPKIAAEHYLMSRERHFEDVVGGATAGGSGAAGTGPGAAPGAGERADSCDAICDAVATRIATPHAAAAGGTRRHETTEPAATVRVTAGSSQIAQVIGTREIGRAHV